MPELRGVLAGDCPHRGSPNIQDLCDVHFPELPELFLGGEEQRMGHMANITVALALVGDKRLWFARIRRGVSGQATGKQVGAAATLGGLFHPKMRLVRMRNCNVGTRL